MTLVCHHRIPFFLPLKNSGAFSQYVLTGSLLVMLHVAFIILKEGLSGIITVSRASKGLKFNVNRQKCKLILTIKKFHGVSNLAFLSVLCISADLHGRLAPEEPPN